MLVYPDGFTKDAIHECGEASLGFPWNIYIQMQFEYLQNIDTFTKLGSLQILFFSLSCRWLEQFHYTTTTSEKLLKTGWDTPEQHVRHIALPCQCAQQATRRTRAMCHVS